MICNNGTRSKATLILILSDIASFILSGLFALLIAVHLDKATFNSFQDFLTLDGKNRVMDYALWSVIWVIWFGAIVRRYSRRIPFWAETLEATRTIAIFALLHLAAISLSHHDFSRSIWLIGWLSLAWILPFVRTIARGLMKRLGQLAAPLFIIGEGRNAQYAKSALLDEWQMGFDFKEFVPISDALTFPRNRHHENQKRIIPAYAVALDEEDSTLINQIVTHLSLVGIRDIYVIPNYRGLPLHGAELSFFFSQEVLMLRIRNNLEPRISRLAKRAFDLLAGSLMLLPCLSLIAVAALVIKGQDGGPVFFIQERLGKGGKTFRMLKVRTMALDAEERLAQWKQTKSPEWQEYVQNNFKLRNDPRLLKAAGLLREFSIDELPQLLNVLKGEMSLVGPRPILAREAHDYGDNLSLYESSVPGITGLWQVSGRSDTSFAERAALDAWYIRNWSLAFDFILLLKTIRAVVGRHGAF